MSTSYMRLREAIRTGYCLMKKQLDIIKPSNDFNRGVLRELKAKIALIDKHYDFENPDALRYKTRRL